MRSDGVIKKVIFRQNNELRRRLHGTKRIDKFSYRVANGEKKEHVEEVTIRIPKSEDLWKDIGKLDLRKLSQLEIMMKPERFYYEYWTLPNSFILAESRISSPGTHLTSLMENAEGPKAYVYAGKRDTHTDPEEVRRVEMRVKKKMKVKSRLTVRYYDADHYLLRHPETMQDFKRDFASRAAAPN